MPRKQDSLLTIDYRRKRYHVSLRDLRSVTRLALRVVGKQRTSLHIALVSDATIRSLNRRFHHQDCVTDCLAFGYGKSKRSSVEGGPLHLGDVVISLDRTRVHARKWKQRFQHELWRYVIHGILHLVGYRDNTARNRGRMEKRQESILKKAIREVG